MVVIKNKKRRGKSQLFLCGLALIILGIIFVFASIFKTYNLGKVSICAPFGLGQYDFNRAELSERELDIAWKLYIQLVTRKAAIPIEDDDIIVEVYDSWYQLFSTTREYLLELPSQDLEENKNAQQIVKLSIEVLNKGLRPHLTKWQGKYRKWYEEAVTLPENALLSPQEIQKKYPEYPELLCDIKKVNKELILYSDELKRFSHEKPPNFSSKIIARTKLFLSRSSE